MIIGIDPGERRVGVAVADLETRFARPHEVIDRQQVDAVGRISAIVEELGAGLVVVGRPTGLSGRSGPAVESQEEFVAELMGALSVEVREFDERFTSIVADRGLRSAGVKAKDLKSRRDAVAAQIMLQGYLDATKPSIEGERA
ncbi:MAG TPA: Holliday junction resolvase RuvX [Actinomycetota bacterium]|nr:Holliday junction resolvase RuvX [Actinomycetota bacterium]